MKLISIVTPCYNEEANVLEMSQKIKSVFKNLPGYKYEHIFIDNKSTDDTARILKTIATEDKRVKVILNVRNFGPGRSCGHAFLQARGDAVIGLACDFQDPPELIPEFISLWEKGYKVVFGQKNKSEENKLMFSVRRLYYGIIQLMAETKQLTNVTGFGLYDRSVVDYFRMMDDPDPYFRGAVTELGYEIGLINYVQPRRRAGKSSYNLVRYIGTAITGLVSTSKTPLRASIYLGFIMSLISLLIAVFYFVMKLIHWYSFDVGFAPILIGVFFFGSVQLACIGILGEYIGAILGRVSKRPLVVESERINFDINENNIREEPSCGED